MKIIIFGATGSIGQQSIDIIKESQHQLVGISYYHNVFLASKINAPFFFSPINQSNVSSYEDLIIKSKPDLIINAVSGFDGLEISLLSIKHKINLALANKESVVVAGSFLFKKAKLNGVTIYPIDSEHTSLMHIIRNHQQEFKRIYITASGGHFYNKKNSEINTVSYNQIIKHPTWKMGEKISIDSSTLMNKCFEIIECYWYFNTKKISVLYHPQSLVHAIILFKNIALACIYQPSMTISIKMVIDEFKDNDNFIKKIDLKKNEFHLEKIKNLKPIRWGYKAIKTPNSSFPIVLEAANEYFVNLFKDGKIKFIDIVKNVNSILKKTKFVKINNIQDVYKIHHQTIHLCQTLY